jgi:NAD(P)-dependent dehydrogenase (short-subunit alcohol dehydrogenase family)
MRGSVRGCVAVTGAASGIGRAVAERLAAEGYALGLVDSDRKALKHVAESLPGAVAHEVDVRDEEALGAALRALASESGPLVGLVTSAGIPGRLSPVDELADVNDVFAVNALGTMHAVKHAVPLMREAGGGSIVCIASAAAFVGTPLLAAYAASKGAIVSFAKCAAVELANEGIRVNTVCPGIVQTPMVEDVTRQRGGSPHAYGPIDNLLERVASPPEIAEAVLFVLSDRGSFVVGTDLVVDGGKLAR